MSILIALLQFLLTLAGIEAGGITYSDRIARDGHEVLASRARVQDGIARFECRASSSGWCHYTLYRDGCDGGVACEPRPLRRFALAGGDSTQLAGLPGFRLCVDLEPGALGPDCKPVAPDAQ